MIKFNFVNEILARHDKNYLENERKKLIANSKELDSLVFKGELSKEECEQKNNEIEKQLIKLDLEISLKNSKKNR